MQEVTSTPKPAPKQSGSLATIVRRHPRRTAVLLIGLVIALVLWAVYTVGYNKGKTNTQSAADIARQNQNNPLLTLPASGTVSEVSGKEITIALLGTEKQTATIDNQTQVTTKIGTGKISDVTKGSKVVLFTAKSGNKTRATKIVLQ